jgi:hypothetical protein
MEQYPLRGQGGMFTNKSLTGTSSFPFFVGMLAKFRLLYSTLSFDQVLAASRTLRMGKGCVY